MKTGIALLLLSLVSTTLAGGGGGDPSTNDNGGPFYDGCGPEKRDVFSLKSRSVAELFWAKVCQNIREGMLANMWISDNALNVADWK